MARDEDVLQTLIEWIEYHPNLTTSELRKTITSLPWAQERQRYVNDLPVPRVIYPLLRTDWEVPSTDALNWKLRYLEVLGKVKCINKRWIVADSTSNSGPPVP